MILTADDLIADIKLRGSVPTSSNRFTNALFLSLSNSEMESKILPMVIAARQNYYEYNIDTAINATGLYPIHTRAFLSMLLNVSLVTSTNRFDLSLLDEDAQTNLDSPSGGNVGFLLKRNTIQLKPLSGSGYTSLRQTIALRPGSFVLLSAAAQITAVSGSTLTFAASAIPSTWDTGDTFDLIQANPQFDTLNIDLSASTVDSSGGSIVLTSTPDTNLAVGDYIALAGQSPVVQVPDAFSYFLSQRVANVCMRIMGKKEELAAGMEIAKEMEEDLQDAIQPRVQREAPKIVNRTGILRRGNL